MKLKIAKAEDRDTLCVILCRNGYTVRQTKEKPVGSKVFRYYVEVVEHGN